MTPFAEPAVAERFAAYPPQVRGTLLELRELVFDTARHTPGVGTLQETLRWGEPAYLTPNGAGSTVRMDWKPRHPRQYALYFNCQTTLVETFRLLFPHDFRFEGQRALLFDVGQRVPTQALAFCMGAALTYHLKKKGTPARGSARGRA